MKKTLVVLVSFLISFFLVMIPCISAIQMHEKTDYLNKNLNLFEDLNEKNEDGSSILKFIGFTMWLALKWYKFSHPIAVHITIPMFMCIASFFVGIESGMTIQESINYALSYLNIGKDKIDEEIEYWYYVWKNGKLPDD